MDSYYASSHKPYYYDLYLVRNLTMSNTTNNNARIIKHHKQNKSKYLLHCTYVPHEWYSSWIKQQLSQFNLMQ
ncbi:unnamed protein product [Paramecium octaurelia]|uniref:Uncharacterized protein n=1 Tax=Paramecium octaurelia TaxID=43137 RepID=A0A8S1WTJ9_PAROT|nr:unnamed protein product [Paramecium octaurelia]